MKYQSFKITQNAIIKNIDNEVLILKHKTNKWLLPGGKINKGETWIEGLKREIKEEIGIKDFKIEKILDFDCWTEENKGKCGITFLVSISDNLEIRLNDEHIDYAWIKENDLNKYDFWHKDIEKRIKMAFE